MVELMKYHETLSIYLNIFSKSLLNYIEPLIYELSINFILEDMTASSLSLSTGGSEDHMLSGLHSLTHLGSVVQSMGTPIQQINTTKFYPAIHHLNNWGLE